jgi:hypothetical protein
MSCVIIRISYVVSVCKVLHSLGGGIRMASRTGCAFVALLFFSASAAMAVGPPASVELHGLKFPPPIAFSPPASAGLDALVVMHPADAKAGGEKISLTAVSFPKDSGMSDDELRDYVKTTFLATSAAGKPVERTFLGKSVTGAAIEKKIPAPSLAEVYVVTKKDGGKVVLGFVFAPDFAKEAEVAIAKIAATLKENQS